jgi:F-type H+-transporting ATPase subunit gamma
MDTLDNLSRKIIGAQQLKSVVRTMKALAASNIGQFEMAVKSLDDYYKTVMLGITACLKENKIDPVAIENPPAENKKKRPTCAIIFGSDQGLVGQFNESLLNFLSDSLADLAGNNKIWSVGERIQLSLANIGVQSSKQFYVPNSVNAIAPLVAQILTKVEEEVGAEHVGDVIIFYNEPKSRTSYLPVGKRLLPLDEKWRKEIATVDWPTNTFPQVVGETGKTLGALIHEYFFVSLFKACAESLASENASRLNAMQRAEKNIEELLEDFGHKYHQIRQSSIDEELFDVVAGFEAMKKDSF